MAFTLSGTTITQSGTDTELSGLSGIAGVSQFGDIYVLDGLRLEIQGTLSFNALTERLVFENYNSVVAGASGYRGALTVRETGTLTNTARRGDGSVLDLPVVTVSGHTCIFGTQAGAPGERVAIETYLGSVVSLEGVFIVEAANVDAGMMIVFGGEINAIDAKFYNLRNDARNQQLGFTPGANLVNFQNVETAGLVIVDRGASVITNFSGVSTRFAQEGYNIGGGTATGIADRYFLIPNFSSDGHGSRDMRTNAGGTERITAEFRDSNKGNSNALTLTDTTGQNCRIFFSSTLNMEFLDELLAPVDATYYAVDNDNGLRQGDFIPAGQSLIAAGSDLVYTGTAVAGAATATPITGIFGPNPGIALDNRGVNPDGDILFGAIAYNNNIAAFQPSLLGLGEKSTTAILPTDTLITESDKATTDAYTELETSAKFYDRAKAYLVDNYAGEKETIVSRTGDTIDAGAYDVELRSGGSNVFEFDGTTITVRSGTSFTGNITTTGTVTFQGSANINGFIIDANGDSFLAPVGIDSYTVHDTEADSNANLNPIGGGTGDEIFRFNFIAPRIYYVRAIAGGVVFQIQVPVAESGRTEVSLSELAVLQSIKATTDSIKTRQATLNRNIQKGSLSIPATEELTNE